MRFERGVFDVFGIGFEMGVCVVCGVDSTSVVGTTLFFLFRKEREKYVVGMSELGIFRGSIA